MDEIYAQLVEASRARGVAPDLIRLDDESSGNDFLPVEVGREEDGPRSFPLSIGIDTDSPVTIVVSPLWRKPGFRGSGEWMGEDEIPGGDVVEFAAACTDRVVLLAQGEVIADGPAAEVLTASPAFAPQVAKVLHPVPVLTVADLTDRLRHR